MRAARGELEHCVNVCVCVAIEFGVATGYVSMKRSEMTASSAADEQTRQAMYRPHTSKCSKFCTHT